MDIYLYLFIVVLKVLTRTISQQKEVKEILKKVRPSLFADGMIVYISHPQNSTKVLLQLINTFSNVAR